MRPLLALVAAAAAAAAQPPAPRATAADLERLAGAWAGTLEYLDYADGKTRQKLATTLDCARTDGGVEQRFSYVEPNGKAVAGTPTRLAVADGGAAVKVGDETWAVAGRTATAGRMELVLTRGGTDDKQPAEFRRVVAVEKDTLTIRTEVRRGTDEKGFVRNEYVLKRR